MRKEDQVQRSDPRTDRPFAIFAGGADFDRIVRGMRRGGAVNDNNAPLRPTDELADLHRMLDKHGVPRDHGGRELSLQGRIQEFAFMAAAGAVKL
jgi:hypothetical protein